MPRRSRARQQVQTSQSVAVGAGSPLDLLPDEVLLQVRGAWRRDGTCNSEIKAALKACISSCPGGCPRSLSPSQLSCGATRGHSSGTVKPWREGQHGDLGGHVVSPSMLRSISHAGGTGAAMERCPFPLPPLRARHFGVHSRDRLLPTDLPAAGEDRPRARRRGLAGGERRRGLPRREQRVRAAPGAARIPVPRTGQRIAASIQATHAILVASASRTGRAQRLECQTATNARPHHCWRALYVVMWSWWTKDM